jgi:hypothetical protein
VGLVQYGAARAHAEEGAEAQPKRTGLFGRLRRTLSSAF